MQGEKFLKLYFYKAQPSLKVEIRLFVYIHALTYIEIETFCKFMSNMYLFRYLLLAMLSLVVVSTYISRLSKKLASKYIVKKEITFVREINYHQNAGITQVAFC